jgi:hypothetical protein
VGTAGFLPFFVTLQRAVPGTFTASVTIAYTAAELALAGIPPAGAAPAPGLDAEADLVVASFHPGACTLGGATCAEDADCGTSGPCAGVAYQPLPTTVDTTAHTATATGFSSFSTLAVLHSGLFDGGAVAPLVLGRGRRRGECRLEWEVIDPGSVVAPGRSRRPTLTCTDGDPTCDADRTADGTCTFRVAPCFGIDTPRAPRCKRTSTTEFRLRVRTRGREGAAEQATTQAVLASVSALRGFPVRRGRLVRFTKPMPPGLCAALTPVRVPAGTSGEVAPMRLEGAVRTLRGSDRDQVGLTCRAAS